MVYCKKDTDIFVKKYCIVWYCLQVGIIGVLAAIVIIAIGLQSYSRGGLLSGSLGMHIYQILSFRSNLYFNRKYNFKKNIRLYIRHILVALDEAKETNEEELSGMKTEHGSCK